MSSLRFDLEDRIFNKMKKGNEAQNTRRLLWIGKFAFPKVNTKTTKLIYVPPGQWVNRFPVIEPIEWNYRPTSFTDLKIDEVELKRWAGMFKRWIIQVTFAYYEKGDTLVIMDKSFQYERRFYESR